MKTLTITEKNQIKHLVESLNTEHETALNHLSANEGLPITKDFSDRAIAYYYTTKKRNEVIRDLSDKYIKFLNENGLLDLVLAIATDLRGTETRSKTSNPIEDGFYALEKDVTQEFLNWLLKEASMEMLIEA